MCGGNVEVFATFVGVRPWPVSFDLLIAGSLNLAAQTGSQANLWASVLFYQGGLAESHHGLAPAYLRGILAVLRFDWGLGVGLLEAFPVAAAAVLITCNALVGLVMFLVLFRKDPPVESPEPHLHWNPEIPRRGMGDLIRSVNHIAIIVSDVGRSLAFYTEIIGFQQIQRPNFDRHGAWLTMGNLELHLIKGVPNAPSGRDLIVSHIALDTNEPHKVLEKLLEYEVPFRQNISVPDPQKARENLVEAFESSEGKITQYFVRDPDGYYLELCNCDVLTAFCLFKENAKEKKPGYVPKYKKLMDAMLSTYNESGQVKGFSISLSPALEDHCHRSPPCSQGTWRVEQAFSGAGGESTRGSGRGSSAGWSAAGKVYRPPKDLLRHLPRVLGRGLGIGSLQEWELRSYSFASVGGMPPRCPSLLSPSIPLERGRKDQAASHGSVSTHRKEVRCIQHVCFKAFRRC